MSDPKSGTCTENIINVRRADHLRTMLFQDTETIELFLDQFLTGVIITDPEGIVVFMNKPYGRFLELDPKAQVGRHVTEVVENTRMHIVGRTGRPEINETQVIRGQSIVVQRLPIIKNGRVIAVFGIVMFQCVGDLQKLAAQLKSLESKVKVYEKELRSLRSTRYTVDSIVGESKTLEYLKQLVFRAAAHNLTVLITGESGCGKELYAQAIHNAGAVRLGPFVRVNASAIPADLLESEMFGYEKGAFTGAKPGGKLGKFHMAHHGTIFFDEIGDLPERMQPKLLRVLEEKEFEPVGGTTPVKSDFRLIAATNRDLDEMVKDNRFRSDLYYRLNVFHLHIPPLRERPDDILPQARHFLTEIAEEWSICAPVLTPETEKILLNYPWPGNSRELKHVIQRTVATLDGAVIRPQDLPLNLFKMTDTLRPVKPAPLKKILNDAEAEAIRAALKAASNNKVQASKILGIHRTMLYRRMKQLGMDCSAPPEGSNAAI
ncbi:MAG: sigma 54-interacting transcriptional regulator [Desulfobacteraceae bacterium]|nr:sigma 54-interacting transcriptional regulator [Desulfobacteraceae bacterium]